jgi:hypothetical protein
MKNTTKKQQQPATPVSPADMAQHRTECGCGHEKRQHGTTIWDTSCRVSGCHCLGYENQRKLA